MQKTNNILPFRRRLDLEVRENLDGDDQDMVVIKDPISQRYFELTRNSSFVLEQIDGNSTLDDIKNKYHQAFSPSRIESRQLEQLLWRFHRDGLIYSTATGQGERDYEKEQERQDRELLGRFSNVLAIRFRGVDPERLLSALNNWVGWIFSAWTVAIVLIVASAVCFVTLSRWDQIVSDMPAVNSFFQIESIALFFVVFSLTKILHEFGHGLACKRLGGECHEIGFMLLVMTPCLFCNVSDSWLLKNKWHRIAVSAGGMYVEVILATIAAVVWMNTGDGWIHMVAIQVMLLCSVNTILFNGNPLLKFDGYYILSDFLEIPNLMQRSNNAFKSVFKRIVFGEKRLDSGIPDSNRIVFATYALLSSIYRWVILFSIIWFLTGWLEPRGLKSLGVLIAALAIAGIIIPLLIQVFRHFQVPGQYSQLFRPRAVAGAGILAGTLIVLALLPLPHFIQCDVVMMPSQMKTVYASQPGTLKAVKVVPGQMVQNGQLIAQIQNDELELRRIDMMEQLKLAHAELESLTGPGKSTEWSSDRMAGIEARIEGLGNGIRLLDQQQDSQDVVASISGRVVSVHYQNSPEAGKLLMKGVLPQNAMLLDKDNIGSYLNQGTRVCDIVNEEKWKAVILISQQQYELIDEGHVASLRLFLNPFKTINCKIDVIGPSDLMLTAGGLKMESKYSETRGPTIVETLVSKRRRDDINFLATAEVESPSQRIRLGSGGKARMFCGYSSIGSRLSRYLRTHFN